MSLLQDAAEYEERHWGNYLTCMRGQAARDYLSQVGKVLLLILLAVLLLDGARRDLSHGSASVVAFTPGATLQTLKGKSAPSFIGQSFNLGATLATDTTGTVTLAFFDGSVIQLSPGSQLRLTQSDAFRNGQRRRLFELTSGSALVYAPPTLETHFATPAGLSGTKSGSFRFDSQQGVLPDGASALTRYTTKPGLFVRLEKAVWWPLDFVLGKVGIMGAGTLLKTDSQRRDDANTASRALQRALIQNTVALPMGRELSLEQSGLSGDALKQAQSALAGPIFVLTPGGGGFVARVMARDSAATVFTITATRVEEVKKKK